MKVISRILLALSYSSFLLWVFYHAKVYKLPEHYHWILAVIGAVLVIISWIIYQVHEKRQVDPFGLEDDLKTEKPEQTSYMVCFSIYGLIGLGALWYFAIS